MNIFKVLASAKKGFQEEYASAILAWLLNPSMEHGLGYAFLTEFLAEAGKADGAPDGIRALATGIRAHLRGDSQGSATCKTFLELNVEQAFIDVVVDVEACDQRWIVAIENKIFSTSASDPKQLTREYAGLCEDEEVRSRGQKILMVFLVPTEGRALHARVLQEWSDLTTNPGDGKVLMTWDGGGSWPSVSAAISSLLIKDSLGNAEPLHEGTRHMLKALRRFIEDGFDGYSYEPEARASGLNARTEARLDYRALKLRSDGWVGVRHGIGGLLRIMSETGGLAAYARPFQYTTRPMKTERYWIPLSTFMEIASLEQPGGAGSLVWMDDGLLGRLPGSLIHFVAQRSTVPFFVGINRGTTGLQAMHADKISEQRWQIGTNQKSQEWISSAEFETICAGMGVTWP